MKKLLLTICAGAFLSVFVNANNADLFTYDGNQVNQELSQLQSLENYVSANPDVSLASLQAENNSLIADLNMPMSGISGFGASGEPVLGIPSFLWGCVLTWVGVLIVYFVSDQDKEETKKALIGCVVSGAAYVIFWIVYAVALGGTLWYY